MDYYAPLSSYRSFTNIFELDSISVYSLVYSASYISPASIQIISYSSDLSSPNKIPYLFVQLGPVFEVNIQ